MHTHPFTPQTDTSPTPQPCCRGPAACPPLCQRPGPGGRSGGGWHTVGPGASHRTRVVGVLFEAEGFSLLPSRRFSTGSQSYFPGREQQLRAEPVGTGHSRRLLSLSLWLVRSQPRLLGAALGSRPLKGGGGLGERDALRFAGQPGCEGDGAPNPRLAPVAPWRAQSNDCPRPRLPRLGGARPPILGATHFPSSACPSAPGLPLAGDAGPGMEVFVFISDWGGRAAAHGTAWEHGASCGRAKERGWVWRARGKEGPGSASEASWMLQDSTDPSLFFF